MHVKMIIRGILTLLFFSGCLCDDRPHVKTPLGEVRGTVRTSDGGKKYSAFEGIPYAKPPIGDRRFEEPEPIEPWTGVWNASFLTQCAQTSIDFLRGSEKEAMDEDCLHINVYVPREEPDSNEKLDVIVHIHGGAYMYCSGHYYIDLRYVMDHDVIFVTFNYRLGILGFLSTEDDVVPGNNGLKDQVLALKWVQQNIASFGGNPDSVTITGMSAGGSSVHMHYFSELSKGLFHRGVSHSGVALNSFSFQEEPLTKAKILAEAVGCPTSCTSTMVKCLKQRPYHHLLAQMPLFFAYQATPLAPFAPVVEKGSKSTAFLSDNPYRLLTQGKVYDVPWITSNTPHEGYLAILLTNNTVDKLNREWEDLAPYLLDFDYTVPRSRWREVSRKIKEFYLGKEDINMDKNLLKTLSLLSDRTFLVDAEDAVRLQAKAIKSPVYYLMFSYPGDDNELNIVPHGGDAKYYFGDKFYSKPLSSNDLKMKNMLYEMLISFVKTGKPTIQGVHWEPTKSDVLTFLNITSVEREKNKLQTTEELTPRAFWKSLGLQENANLLSNKDEL